MSKLYKCTCKVEDLPIVAQYIRENYISDIKEFKKYSLAFDDDFLKEYDKKFSQLSSLYFPDDLDKEIKILRKKIYLSLDKLRPCLNKIEACIKKAKHDNNILPPKKDFKLSELRDQINVRDIIAVIELLGKLLNIIDLNNSILKAKGYTDADRENLKNLYLSIISDNNIISEKTKNYESHFNKNSIIINSLWDMMKDITNAGKIIFRYDSQSKIQNYSMSNLKAKARKQAGRE
jgi:uncharacterized protein YfkK (UPF0435 family)